jgi:hypothetical protein
LLASFLLPPGQPSFIMQTYGDVEVGKLYTQLSVSISFIQRL